jgi:probable F420-dependent oxidoreductase
MDFGLVAQANPPAMGVVELAKRAEAAGFTHFWTFDSCVLWQEPFVIYSRTICGIGRGDSALRVTGRSPASLATLAECIDTVKKLVEGREATVNDRAINFPWVDEGSFDVWMAAYGPKALEVAGRDADGLIMQLADPFIVQWAINVAREARRASNKDVATYKVCVAAPAYVGENLAHQRDQVRWFGGMVGNHVADIVERYGSDSPVPAALTEYIKGRKGYDYRHHGQAGNPDTEFVPDEVIDRFCVLGPVEHHLERLSELAESGVDQFSLYLMHDDPETTIEAYRTSVIGRV